MNRRLYGPAQTHDGKTWKSGAYLAAYGVMKSAAFLDTLPGSWAISRRWADDDATPTTAIGVATDSVGSWAASLERVHDLHARLAEIARISRGTGEMVLKRGGGNYSIKVALFLTPA